MDWLGTSRGMDFDDYDALHAWSVTELEDFWQSVWDYFGIVSSVAPTDVLVDASDAGRRSGSLVLG